MARLKSCHGMCGGGLSSSLLLMCSAIAIASPTTTQLTIVQHTAQHTQHRLQHGRFSRARLEDRPKDRCTIEAGAASSER